MNDGGCHYHLWFQPGTVITENYCEGKGWGCPGPSGASTRTKAPPT